MYFLHQIIFDECNAKFIYLLVLYLHIHTFWILTVSILHRMFLAHCNIYSCRRSWDQICSTISLSQYCVAVLESVKGKCHPESCTVTSPRTYWWPTAYMRTLQDETDSISIVYIISIYKILSVWNELVHAGVLYTNNGTQVFQWVIWLDFCPIFDLKQWIVLLPGTARLSKYIIFTTFIPSRVYSLHVFSSGSLGCFS